MCGEVYMYIYAHGFKLQSVYSKLSISVDGI